MELNNRFAKFYHVLFFLLVVSVFFTDNIVIKPLGILGQLSVVIMALYLFVFLLEKVATKTNPFKWNTTVLLYAAFILALLLSFVFSPQDLSVVFKDENPTMKFLKQLLAILIWGAFFYTSYQHFTRFKKDLPLNRVMKYTIGTFAGLCTLGFVEWLLYLNKSELHSSVSKVFHTYFVNPYDNVYAWLIGIPRFRLVEGEPVHASIAMGIFIVLFFIGLCRSEYKKMSFLCMLIALIFNFMTFSRSAYLIMWVIVVLSFGYLFFAWKAKKSWFRLAFVAIILFQTMITFPFLNDSALKYFSDKFDTTKTIEVTPSEHTPSTPTMSGEEDHIEQSELSNNTRGISTLISIDILKDYPLLGVGWGIYGFQFQNYFPKYSVMAANNWEFLMYNKADETYFWPEQHSFLLRLLSESGVIGTLLFALLMISVFFPVFKMIRYIKTKRNLFLIIVSMLAVLVIGQLLMAISGLNLVYIPFFLGMLYFLLRNEDILEEETV